MNQVLTIQVQIPEFLENRDEDITVLNNGEIYVMLFIPTCILAITRTQMSQQQGENTVNTDLSSQVVEVNVHLV